MRSSNFGARLLSALHDSVSNFNQGMSPTAAVAKTAEAEGFNPDQTKRLCERFNTARTLHHFERRPGEKEAVFALADYDAVMLALHSGSEKAASADTMFDYSMFEDTNGIPRGWSHGVCMDTEPELVLTKAAEDFADLDLQAQRLYTTLDSWKSAALHARSSASQAECVVTDAIDKLANDISHDVYVRGNARFRKLAAAVHGDLELSSVWASVRPRIRGVDGVTKSADSVIDTADIQTWVSELSSIYAMAKAAASVLADAEALDKDAQSVEREFAAIVRPGAVDVFDDILSPKLAQSVGNVTRTVPANRMTSWLTPMTDDERSDLRKATSTKNINRSIEPGTIDRITSGIGTGIGDAATNYMTDTLAAISQNDSVRKSNQRASDSLRNHQREIVLQELMLTDPFISEADPQHVADAYAAIVNVSPHIAMNKEIMRAVLRQSVQSVAMSPYDASGVADLEKTVREISGTMPPREIMAPPAASGNRGSGGRR